MGRSKRLHQLCGETFLYGEFCKHDLERMRKKPVYWQKSKHSKTSFRMVSEEVFTRLLANSTEAIRTQINDFNRALCFINTCLLGICITICLIYFGHCELDSMRQEFAVDLANANAPINPSIIALNESSNDENQSELEIESQTENKNNKRMS